MATLILIGPYAGEPESLPDGDGPFSSFNYSNFFFPRPDFLLVVLLLLGDVGASGEDRKEACNEEITQKLPWCEMFER